MPVLLVQSLSIASATGRFPLAAIIIEITAVGNRGRQVSDTELLANHGQFAPAWQSPGCISLEAENQTLVDRDHNAGSLSGVLRADQLRGIREWWRR